MYIWQLDFNMKNWLLLFCCSLVFELNAQVVGTPIVSTAFFQTPLDLISYTPSFAFGTRKLKSSYNGAILKVRKSTDNSQVDVYFDSRNRISNQSKVIYVVAGTSGQSLGTASTLSNFKASAQLFVTQWYDQSGNNRHAIQGSNANQPELLLDTQNQQAILVFDGTKNLPVATTPAAVFGTTTGGVAGVTATFFLNLKITQASTQTSAFGFADNSTNYRFMSHLNWSDNNLYFDAGEICCAPQTGRFFANATSVNYWKQFTFQRQDVTKIIRISGIEKINGNGNAATSSASVTNFGIGCVNNVTSTGLVGQISEVILYNRALTSLELAKIEKNQMANWSSF